VISTGAAGGYFAIRFARMIGARTLFVDRIANTRQLSVSARKCLGVADHVLSQWPEIAKRTKAQFWGAVL
jgi:hypothetical protein